MEFFITPGSAAIVAIILGTYFMFQKVGEAGWKAAIPFYSEYTEYKIAWNTKMFWVSLALIAMAASSFIVSSVALAMHLGNQGPFILVTLISLIAWVIIQSRKSYKLSQLFGHGFGFSLGLTFLAPIFKIILGFDESKYVVE